MTATGARAKEASSPSSPETVVKTLFDSLSPEQRQAIAFPWDHIDKQRGKLRTFISNNWRITSPLVASKFFTPDQQQMIRDIFTGMIQPDWLGRFDKQLQDDMGGFGKHQSIAIFGTPGEDKFEFVLSGRHLTLRCDGNSTEHVAFGGPILYGHAASGFYEKPGHPDNVFWPQALAANRVYQMLDGKQREAALVKYVPDEAEVGFRGTSGNLSGIPVTDLSTDQRQLVEDVLKILLETFRKADQDEVAACLKKQGGLEQCHLAFYRDGDLGRDEVWDNWRLEGPSFVWHFRGAPHVHVWVNIADDPSVPLNAKNLSLPDLRSPKADDK